MNRRHSETLKKSEVLKLNKLVTEENNKLKQEVAALNSLVKSQQERHLAEVESLKKENDILAYHNNELIITTLDLQKALLSIKSEITENSGGVYKAKVVGNCYSSDRVKTSINKENTPCDFPSTSKSRSNTKDKISPLKAGLIKDSRKLSLLVNKIKKLQK